MSTNIFFINEIPKNQNLLSPKITLSKKIEEELNKLPTLNFNFSKRMPNRRSRSLVCAVFYWKQSASQSLHAQPLRMCLMTESLVNEPSASEKW